MNDLTFVWSFRNRMGDLSKSIELADQYCSKSVNFCLVDADSEWYNIKILRELANNMQDPNLNRFDEEVRNIRVCESAYRTNLSEAWNLGMMLSNTRYVAFLSCDTYLKSSSGIEALYGSLVAGNMYTLVENHGFFGLDKAIVPRVGWFDESFIPGPHFDCDYMIRASEAGIRVKMIPNLYYYDHSDAPEVTKQRLAGEVKDRLPMHDLYNEEYFKKKWESSWPGWRDAPDKLNLPHPPTHITQVKRKIEEIDSHPLYTKRFKDEYSTIRT